MTEAPKSPKAEGRGPNAVKPQGRCFLQLSVWVSLESTRFLKTHQLFNVLLMQQERDKSF